MYPSITIVEGGGHLELHIHILSMLVLSGCYMWMISFVRHDSGRFPVCGPLIDSKLICLGPDLIVFGKELEGGPFQLV